MRFGRWKAIRQPGGTLELYDLETDLGETTDVAADHPQEAAKAREYMIQARTESEFWPLAQ